MGLAPIDVPADGSCYLHVLLLLRNWNLSLVPNVATARIDVSSFLTTARMNVITGERTLDEVRGKMEDQVTVGRR